MYFNWIVVKFQVGNASVVVFDLFEFYSAAEFDFYLLFLLQFIEFDWKIGIRFVLDGCRIGI